VSSKKSLKLRYFLFTLFTDEICVMDRQEQSIGATASRAWALTQITKEPIILRNHDADFRQCSGSEIRACRLIPPEPS
jgi:hypothetical protein